MSVAHANAASLAPVLLTNIYYTNAAKLDAASLEGNEQVAFFAIGTKVMRGLRFCCDEGGKHY